jgi:hypothetical protein
VVAHRHGHVYRTVRVHPSPAFVHYYPEHHVGCRVHSGYYHHPQFGYHRHGYHPGGIHFGIRLVF